MVGFCPHDWHQTTQEDWDLMGQHPDDFFLFERPRPRRLLKSTRQRAAEDFSGVDFTGLEP